MLLSTMTFVTMAAVYPLMQLGALPEANSALRLVSSTQLVTASIGSLLGLSFTLFAWVSALTGAYQVDTFSGIVVKENPLKKLERAANLTLREQVLILFGTTDPLEILDTMQYE